MTFRASKPLLGSRPSQGRAILVVCLAVIMTALWSVPCHADSITKISTVYDEQFQTITITGTGFGTFSTPFTGTSLYIDFEDLSALPGWSAGYSGYSDTIPLIVDSWSDTSIVLGGFGGGAGGDGSNNYVLKVGDLVKVWVNPGGPSAGTYPTYVGADSGPSIETNVVGVTPEPGSLALLMLGFSIIGVGAVIMKRKDFQVPLVG
jgi:hypothetical protein